MKPLYSIRRSASPRAAPLAPTLAQLRPDEAEDFDATPAQLRVQLDRLLLDALDRPARYLPIDISGEYLAAAAALGEDPARVLKTLMALVDGKLPAQTILDVVHVLNPVIDPDDAEVLGVPLLRGGLRAPLLPFAGLEYSLGR